MHMLAFCQVDVLNEYDDDDDRLRLVLSGLHYIVITACFVACYRYDGSCSAYRLPVGRQ